MGSDISWPEVLTRLLKGENLSISQAEIAMNEIIAGRASNAQIAAFLIALRAKGESVDEVLGFRSAVLENALQLSVPQQALDIVGTGGDRHNTINISTTASLVSAGSGIPVVKHGNKAASSASGSSDVLSELGINLTLSPEQVSEVFEQCGITFAHAAAFHPGFRHAAEARRDLGIPTIFNILGPLCNPAKPIASAVGVSQLERIPLITSVFAQRDATALVFRGDDGLDELSTTGMNHVWEVQAGTITEHVLDPRELGIEMVSLDDLRGGEPSFNAQVVHDVLNGKLGPHRDVVLLNAAAGIAAYQLALDPAQSLMPLAERLRQSLVIAAEAIDNGAAAAKLRQWVSASQNF